MEYAAITFWLFVIVLTALAVHRLWSSLIQPKVVNSILLPGTLVAQLGYVLGLLVTGGTVNNTALITDNEDGEPQTGEATETRVPIIGTIIIALLPMAGCAVAIYWVSQYLGSEMLTATATHGIAFDQLALPTSIAAFFAMIRDLINLVERFIFVLWQSDLTNWQTALFLYLSICLTVRMAPLTGNLRGSLGAILLFGIFAFLINQLTQAGGDAFAGAKPLIVFSLAVLSFLLLTSLLITGIVKLFKTVMDQK